MADRNYRDAGDFARNFRRDLRRMYEAYMQVYHQENHREAKALLTSLTPLGETGRMRSSYVDVVDGSTAPISAIRFGSHSKVSSTDAGFHGVDWGRRRQFYRKGGFSRLGGSEQAPAGMTKPTMARVISRGFQARLRVRATRAAVRALRKR